MDQVYFVGKPDADGRRSVFYRYGNFCYADTLRVDNCNDIRKLPMVMQFLQSVQVCVHSSAVVVHATSTAWRVLWVATAAGTEPGLQKSTVFSPPPPGEGMRRSL